jgi:probable F420-dependent oxidoreductase
MPKVELGRIGVASSPGEPDAAVELARLGYPTIWLRGGQLDNLGQVADVVRATRGVRISTGIIPVDRFDHESVAALYTELESMHPGRFVVGLGGAHGPKPLQTLNAYLDGLDDSVPPTSRVMAALGPRMLALARERAAGAFPVLVTSEYTAWAREELGEDTTLAIDQIVVLETDAERARDIARGPVGQLAGLPSYTANLRRMGFTDDEITRLSDRLVDGIVAWGDVETITARISEHELAGADHVALIVTTASPDRVPVDEWRQLASALVD